jgi:hypothetical protein
MKALISPNEIQNITYISSWDGDEPVYETIENCQRVAEVEPDNKVFEVASPLHWIDCPNDCVADEWYYKDGLYKNPTDAEKEAE